MVHERGGEGGGAAEVDNPPSSAAIAGRPAARPGHCKLVHLLYLPCPSFLALGSRSPGDGRRRRLGCLCRQPRPPSVRPGRLRPMRREMDSGKISPAARHGRHRSASPRLSRPSQDPRPNAAVVRIRCRPQAVPLWESESNRELYRTST